MLVLAESRLAIRQALGSGQLTEEITDRPIEDFEITMSYSHAGGSGRLPEFARLWKSARIEPRKPPDDSSVPTRGWERAGTRAW